MYNLNRVTLIGQLTADPAIRSLSSGQSMATFRVATNYSWKDDSGEWKSGVDYHAVVAWQRVAQNVEQLNKGVRVFVEGKIRSRTWQTEDGTKRYSVEIIASTILPMVSGSTSNSSSVSSMPTDEGQEHDEETISIEDIQEVSQAV